MNIRINARQSGSFSSQNVAGSLLKKLTWAVKKLHLNSSSSQVHQSNGLQYLRKFIAYHIERVLEPSSQV